MSGSLEPTAGLRGLQPRNAPKVGLVDPREAAEDARSSVPVFPLDSQPAQAVEA